MMADPIEKPPGRVAVSDQGEFAVLFDSARFEHAQRVARMFADSDLVPAQYRGKIGNCFLAIQMATRLGIDPFMFMQNTYVVQGRPGIESKLMIALVNTSGIFTDALDYESVGGEPADKTYRVRAFAQRKSTGKVVYGPWIGWPMVEAEGWLAKNGSKWRTMPGVMFAYRAAAFFVRLHCPERLMGMQTREELEDLAAVEHARTTREHRTASLLESLSADDASDDSGQSIEEVSTDADEQHEAK